MYNKNLPTKPTSGGIPAKDNKNASARTNRENDSCKFFNLLIVE